MTLVLHLDHIRRSPTAALFEGHRHGGVDVSIFVTAYPNGHGPDLHLHPYPEVFVVQDGTATFTVGDEEIAVEKGHIVVVPPETPHGFKNRADETLRVVSVHPNGEVLQTDLSP